MIVYTFSPVVLGAGIAALVELATSLSTGHDYQHSRHRHGNFLFTRQSSGSNATITGCHMNYTTDVWTGCADVLAQFNITMDYFNTANPNIGSNCENFVPGNTYCVSIAVAMAVITAERATAKKVAVMEDSLTLQMAAVEATLVIWNVHQSLVFAVRNLDTAGTHRATVEQGARAALA
ncbi:hypothetical protein CFD26_101227 [Aspergillus turcosus]|uniref:LysM domain-containing protein n=1 Tax=Aspergillus turcosus TaxID=1245748 RepID=A0A421CTK8_9EURO|nr:hypothetical protein CFD26_101227 [Aspergillus turcosus]